MDEKTLYRVNVKEHGAIGSSISYTDCYSYLICQFPF